MTWLRTGVLLAAGLAAGTAVAAMLRHRDDDETPSWLVVTVNAEPSRVAGDPRLTEVLANLGAGVETRIVPAPGGRGTEVGVRPAPTGAPARLTGTNPRQDVRRALRDVKSLIEGRP
jgi:hypothetical protein